MNLGPAVHSRMHGWPSTTLHMQTERYDEYLGWVPTRWGNFLFWLGHPSNAISHFGFVLKRRLRDIGIRTYPMYVAKYWLSDVGKELKFYGLILGRVGVAFTWRVK